MAHSIKVAHLSQRREFTFKQANHHRLQLIHLHQQAFLSRTLDAVSKYDPYEFLFDTAFTTLGQLAELCPALAIYILAYVGVL